MLQKEHSAILSTFIKLPLVFMIIVFSIFEWLFYTGFTVYYQLALVLSVMLHVDLINVAYLMALSLSGQHDVALFE